MKRRQFLQWTAGASFSANAGLLTHFENLYTISPTDNLSRVEAKYYHKLPDREIECRLCPRLCKLGDKERGYCGVRENQNGIYYTLVYGKACSLNADPIEKKPFFHFLPGKRALSIATAGCNVNCKFCQNWEISQVRPEQIRHIDLPPKQVVKTAQQYSCPVIAYTYSEPVVFYEYMYDTAMAAVRENIKNVVVTGGHINPDPLLELLKVVDAVKVDLKSFSQDFYTEMVRGDLQPVLDAIKIIAEKEVWMEIVYLVIPSLNDGAEEITKLCRWIKTEIGLELPVHFTRFHPAYLLKNLPPTPVSTLENCHDIAKAEGLHYIYIGNVPGHPAENTYCPKCGEMIVNRTGYIIRDVKLNEGQCAYCQHTIPGIWT